MKQSYRTLFDSHQCFGYTSGGSPRAFPGEACSRPGPCGRLLKRNLTWRNEHIAFCMKQSYRTQFDSHQRFGYTSGGPPAALPGDACSGLGPCGRLLYELEDGNASPFARSRVIVRSLTPTNALVIPPVVFFCNVICTGGTNALPFVRSRVIVRSLTPTNPLDIPPVVFICNVI